MKAIPICEYGGTGTLKLEEVLRISITNDQVLVRIHDAGVNPADWKVRQGYLKQLRRKTVRQASSKMKSPLIRY